MWLGKAGGEELFGEELIDLCAVKWKQVAKGDYE